MSEKEEKKEGKKKGKKDDLWSNALGELQFGLSKQFVRNISTPTPLVPTLFCHSGH